MQGQFKFWRESGIILHINRLKNMIILRGTEKAFDKIQHTILVETLNTLGIEEKFLKLINVIYKK